MDKQTPKEIDPNGTVNISPQYFDQLRQQASQYFQMLKDIEQLARIDTGRRDAILERHKYMAEASDEEYENLWKEADENTIIIVPKQQLKKFLAKYRQYKRNRFNLADAEEDELNRYTIMWEEDINGTADIT